MFVAEEIQMKIFHAIKEIQGSNDPKVFVKRLLRDELKWPIEFDELEEFDFDELGYDWNSELEAMGLRSDEGIQDLFQIAKFPGWPLGMFVVRFGSNSIFTKGRGMTTPLRNLLRNLIEKVRPTASHQTWSQEQLMFLCHHEHTHYEFVRFTNMGENLLPKMQSFGWGPNDGDAIRTLCTENLPHLLYNPSLSEEANLKNIVKAFDIQKISRRFYSDYKSAFANFKSELLEHAGCHDDDELHRYVQLVFNRFLFLRFIEKKRWLRFGDDGNYLRNLYNSFVEKNQPFYKDGFLPMALKGLVVPGEQKSDVYGEVELIGGGLFEASKFDLEFSSLPNEMFLPIIGANGLLYRYNFTVEESTPFDEKVAVDPEMIGTMFEELVTNRDGKGAFYTPRIVVSYMCKEGLKSILEDKTNVDSEKIRELVDFEETDSISIKDAKQIRQALDGIKAIDPACGSGAYLLGLLQEIIKIHGKLRNLPSDDDRNKYDLKLHIISHSIFGVDLDEFATQIAMLRLWLSLAVESEMPVQLPNLDFNIETGDALLAPDPSQVDWFMGDLYEQADKLAEKKEIYLSASTNIEALRKEIKQEEEEIRLKLRKNSAYVNSVDFRIHFAGVFSKNGGFDLVLANPPYVRQEDIKPADYKRNLFQSYKTGSIQPVEKTSDLYCYFYIRALQLLRENGLQIFICSNSWLDVGFGIKLQHYFLKRCNVRTLIDSRKERQFASAEVNTIISIIRKAPPGETEFLMLEGEFEQSIFDPNLKTSRIYQQEELVKAGEDHRNEYTGQRLSLYHRAPQLYLDMMDHLGQHAQPLKHFAKVQRGPVSGKNEFFFVETGAPQMEGIEDEFLYDILRRPQECPQILTSTSSRSVRLFTTTRDKFALKNTKALDYISEGEGMNYHKGSSTKNRKPWYKVRLLDPAPLLWMEIMGKSHRVFLNDANVRHSDKFYGIYVNDPSLDPVKLNIWLNSTPIILHKLLTSFNSLGAGALKTPVYEVENIPVPDLSTIEFDEGAYAEFTSREIKSVDEEMTMEDRITLEAPFMHLLGINEETQAAMRDHVISMIQDRTEKADSVK
jgi:type I restriction-modification system DNA methylase subunit